MTRWSKLDTSWRGVSVDTLLEEVDTAAWCDGGYTTNLALEDVTEGKAWVVYEYDREPRTPSMEGRRGFWSRICTSGRARKWLRGLALMLDDEPGFWETYGYHNNGDPWLEQRYQGD